MSGSYARSSIPAALSSATYDAANQLTAWAGTTLTYDANSNLTNDGTKTYTWNPRNELASMTGTPAASFTYDPFGRRTRKTIAGSSTDFLYDGLNTVQELSGGSPTANLISGGIDEVFQRTDSTGTRSFMNDALGSTVALADSSGTLQTNYTYEPFGNPSGTGQANANSFQFTGRETDGTGLLYYRARYYSPTFGRFLSEDPIGFAGGDVNLHAYALNTPTNYVDPSGTVVDTVGDIGFIAHDPWLLATGSRKDFQGNLDSAWVLYRSLRNAPWTALGLTAAKITGSDTCKLQPGLIIECYENPLLGPGSAITIGSTVTTQLSEVDYVEEQAVRSHENRHVDQWAALGPLLFPPAYLAGALYSQVTTGGPFCGNPIEEAAGKTPAYQGCGWP